MIKRISEKSIFKTRFFDIKEVEIELDGRRTQSRQILEMPDAAFIVAVDSSGNLLLIKEYMTAFNEYQLNLPGGRIDEGQDPKEVASKELQEEIGFKAGRLDVLGVFNISPGYLIQKTYIYLARELSPDKLEGDEVEELKVIKYPLKRFEELIEQGKIFDVRAIGALYLAKKYLGI